MNITTIEARHVLSKAIRDAKANGVTKIPVHLSTLEQLVKEYEAALKANPWSRVSAR